MWGLNFTVIRFGLDEFPPFTFAAWRFILCALPVLFVARPEISWAALAGIGGFMFGGQFVFLFLPCRPDCRGPHLGAGPVAGPAHRGAGRAFPARARHPRPWLGLAAWRSVSC